MRFQKWEKRHKLTRHQKPRAIQLTRCDAQITSDGELGVCMSPRTPPRELRALATWLMRAADYLSQEERNAN